MSGHLAAATPAAAMGPEPLHPKGVPVVSHIIPFIAAHTKSHCEASPSLSKLAGPPAAHLPACTLPSRVPVAVDWFIGVRCQNEIHCDRAAPPDRPRGGRQARLQGLQLAEGSG